MSGLITSATNPLQELKDLVTVTYGDNYNKVPEEYSQMFDVRKSTRGEEVILQRTGMGAARVTPEGARIQLDSGGEGYRQYVRHLDITLGFAITKKAERDGQMGSTMSRGAKDLAEAFKMTKETIHANIINYGTDTGATHLYGDGKPLFATDHPLAGGGTLSNKLSTAAQLSVTSLEQLLTQMHQVTDDRGRPKPVRAKALVIGTGSVFTTERILNSDGQSDTANRAINAIKSTKSIPKHMVNHYLSNANIWFIVSDIDAGLISFQREAYSDDMTIEPLTRNKLYTGWEAYSATAGDSSRAAFGGYTI